jgi:uncharacterized protein YrrD
MLLAASALKGYDIEATDGLIGTVDDLLFDDQSWKIRWLVVDAGNWLTGRKVLLHPSCVKAADHDLHILSVVLTKEQVKGSPGIGQDEPVSRQMEAHLYDYYGWDQYWGPSYFGMGAMASPLSSPPYFGGIGGGGPAMHDVASDHGDPHLHSMHVVIGTHIEATDGAIGHVENLLFDDSAWGIRYIVVDTRNWWPGQHVLVSPYSVQSVDFLDHKVRLDVSRDKVKASPPWDPVGEVNRDYENRLHHYYSWPGYGARVAEPPAVTNDPVVSANQRSVS